MPIRFTCPCGKALTVPDEKAGTRGRCPACKQFVEIPKPGPAAAEEQHLICPQCGGIEEKGASSCSGCGRSFAPGKRVLHVDRPPSILDAQPFRWIGEHKLWLAGGLLVALIYVVYRIVAGPGSEAYDSYRRFANFLLEGDYDRARKLAEGGALAQIERVKSQVGFQEAMQKRAGAESRSVYVLLSEDLSGDGKTSTLRVTQQYWETAVGSLSTVGEQRERDHTAKLSLRKGEWVVAAFDMGPPRKMGTGADSSAAKTSFVRVDADGCGISPDSPLGTLKKLGERLAEAGLIRAAPKEDADRWGEEPAQAHPYDYHLRAKDGKGGWQESIEVVINLDRKVKAVRATFRLSTAAGTPMEESRVARFAADYWKLVVGKEAAPDKDGRAVAAVGDRAGEWKQDRVQSKEVVVLTLKEGGTPAREGYRPYSRQAHSGRVFALGRLPPVNESFSAGQDRIVTTVRRTGPEEKLKHPAEVTAAAAATDGMTLITGCADGKLRRWRREMLDTLFGKPDEWAAHEGGVAALATHPGGELLASAGQDGTIKLWVGSTLKATLRGPKPGVSGLCFLPDGTVLASAGKDGTVRLWDVPGGTELHSLAGHAGPVLAAAFDPDGLLLASGGADGVVRVWDLADRKEAAALKGHEGNVTGVQFLHGGRVLVSCGEDGSLRVWDPLTRESLQVLRSFSGFTCLAAGEGGRTLLSGGEDGIVRTWTGLKAPEERKPREGEAPVKTVPLGRAIESTRRTVLSPAGNAYVSWHPGTGAMLWSPAQGTALPVPKFAQSAFSVALSPDGRHLVAGLYDKRIQAFEVATGKSIATIGGLPANAFTVALSLDLRRAASEFRREGRSRVQVRDVKAGGLVSDFPCREWLEVRALCFAPDGESVAAGMSDGTIQLINAGTGKGLRDLTGHQGEIGALHYSEDGSLLASGGGDGTVRIWRVAEGRQVKCFRDHAGPVASVALDRKAAFVVSAGEEAILRALGTDREPRLLQAKGKLAGEVAFTPEGDGMMWVDRLKGEIRVWTLAK